MAQATGPRFDEKCWYGTEPKGARYEALETIIWSGVLGSASGQYEEGEEIPPRSCEGLSLFVVDDELHHRLGTGQLERIGHINAIPDRESLVKRGLAIRI